jgi:hypothetical protein
MCATSLGCRAWPLRIGPNKRRALLHCFDAVIGFDVILITEIAFRLDESQTNGLDVTWPGVQPDLDTFPGSKKLLPEKRLYRGVSNRRTKVHFSTSEPSRFTLE